MKGSLHVNGFVPGLTFLPFYCNFSGTPGTLGLPRCQLSENADQAVQASKVDKKPNS